MSLVKIKIQFTHGGHIAFGPGKAQLLAAILQYGSISAAAKSMKMSYKRAWDLVVVMNNCFKEPLVMTTVGGSHGGGASITTFGIEMLHQYQDIQTKSEQFVSAETNSFLTMLSPIDS